ncbi:hypothetical protein TVAG_165840 [Trichomonas vaginalis G3]|uniref:Leucine Rich Repeat family protein n=1 Tax=Trichomonas vaginalis (strain ATCC PRA-98 / G3) TaxID=412133 RepID=A2G5G5_TRIV3|nr:hypothetical protein TVAG_165840 [Trichomonas vaginalis G3]|eukprot:XP_001300536.1 hypothetical protein [Trichomonas vaginalis G3]
MADSEEHNSEKPTVIGKIDDGFLDISDKGLTSLACIGVQPSLQILMVSNNNLTSFKSLKPQPNLKCIFAASNPIEFLDCLDKQPKLESLDLSDTPIVAQKRWRLKVLATCKNLITINGEEVTDIEKKRAKKVLQAYPDMQFISDGEKQKQMLDGESQMLQYKMYVRHHSDNLRKFARNEAELWDLQNNGQRPEICDFSTDDEIKRAIIKLRHRNEKIATTFFKK